jgi:hypothetical protein
MLFIPCNLELERWIGTITLDAYNISSCVVKIVVASKANIASSS